MKLVARILFAILLGPLVSHAGPSVPLVLQHVTVIDGTGHSPQQDQTVVISGGRIIAVGPVGRTKFDKTAHVIDGQGKFLIPGLSDMHVHIAGVSADPAWSKDVLLPLLLANGITGVRDMGGDLEVLLSWKHDIESGKLLGPHIVAAGPWLAGGGRKTPEQFPVANVGEARAAVRELKQRGADFIKIISLPSREALFAVAEEARKQGISFAGHLPLDVSAAEASDAGMHSIEHFYYSAFALSLSTKEEALRPLLIAAERKRDSAAAATITSDAIASYGPEKAAVLWSKLKANGTRVTPTLEGIYVAGPPSTIAADRSSLTFIPVPVLKAWRSGVADNSAASARVNTVAKLSENDWKLTGEIETAGVRLLAGSDSLDEGVIPGFSLHLELSQLVKAGLTPMEAIHAATAEAAEFLGRTKDFGIVETGKVADVILLEANPVENIANTRKILAVIRDGRYFDRAALDSLLAKAAAAAQAVR